ncbi:FAD-binding protein [Albirhodobacter sp. R86504]|uniref:FAD-binding protein n=1 Tax=Albirhodobacter sp. R86504 TaxID=3093848 RepID=UPI00367328CA
MTYRPETEADLAEILRKVQAPLEVRGGGTRAVGDIRGEVLETRGLTGVRLYEPGAMTLVVGAGMPLAEVEALLASEGQRLPFEPSGAAGSTIGGVVATNASGPRRVQAGACRDSLIGVRFVDGSGEIIKNGGRVMKNVTGYDLVKLMAGSWGTLGVLTELSFRVLAIPQASATVVVRCAAGEAPRVLAKALGSPFDVCGAAWAEGRALVRVEGLSASVEYRAAQLCAILGGTVEAVDWAQIRDLTPLSGAGDLWQFSLRPSQAADVAARLDAPLIMDWGGGRITARLAKGVDARALAAPYTGHATRLSMGAGAFEPETAPVKKLTDSLRARFDPRGILNAGRLA